MCILLCAFKFSLSSLDEFSRDSESFQPDFIPLRQQPDTPPVVKYASYLKSYYCRQLLPSDTKWGPTTARRFINLALVTKEKVCKMEADEFTKATIHGNIEDILRCKEPIKMSQIAKQSNNCPMKCVLIEGSPGIGKTTFSWELCRRWGRGEILQEYSLVILLRLRDKRIREAKTMHDLFHYYDKQIQRAVVCNVIATLGEGVLLLFEGFDELPTEMRERSSLFLDIIKGECMPAATILITSRSSATSYLLQKCSPQISQHIEILGFTKHDINSYINDVMASDPKLLSDFKMYLHSYPHIHTMMYVPLNCAIVVEVYKYSRLGDCVVPKTMTQLYTALSHTLLLRYLHEHPLYSQSHRRLLAYNDLPREVYQQFCHLCKIAFEGILSNQQLIFSDLPQDFDTLGFMQSTPELYIHEGISMSYNFLHLTVQEYLAAFHISLKVPREQNHLFWRYQESSHFEMVFRFLGGLTKLADLVSDAYLPRQEKGGLIHMLFEAQDSEMVHKVLGTDCIRATMGSSATPYSAGFDDAIVKSTFDFYALGYCVSHSNCPWELDFSSTSCGDDDIEMFVRGMAATGQGICKGQLSTIRFEANGITTKGIEQLLQLPPSVLADVKALLLGNNKLDLVACGVLANALLQMENLEELHLNGNPIGIGGACDVISALRFCPSLKLLDLNYTYIATQDCKCLSSFLQLQSSENLQYLSIENPTLFPRAVVEVVRALKNSSSNSLNYLNMSKACLNKEITICLADMLVDQNHQSLSILVLKKCCIDSEGARILAQVLCKNDTLTVLNLTGNPIQVDGAMAFAEMLKQNKSLIELSVSDYSIEAKGVECLLQSLDQNEAIEALYLPTFYAGVNLSIDDYRINWDNNPFMS